MWELHSKDIYGNVAQIQKEDPFTKQPVYDVISPDNNGFNTAELTVRYTVEWLPERNREAFENAQKCLSGVEPWELRNEYKTDSIGLAIRMLLLRELDPGSDNPTLFMEIEDPNGAGAETCTEIPGDTVSILRNLVQNNINRKLDAYQNTVDELTKELAAYKQFIKSCHAEKTFEEFRKERSI